MKTRYKHEIPLDLHTPLSKEDLEQISKVYGPAPEHKPVKRQPYDSLYVKLKKQRDYWSR